jgi:hypothetical protein
LLLAVIEGAVSDYQKYATAVSGRGRRLFAEAEAWLASSTTDRPLDFESICHAVGLDPSFIRSGLRRWRRESSRRMLPSYLPWTPDSTSPRFGTSAPRS